MYSRIELAPERKFVGKQLTMSFADNPTFELWRSFMPQRQAIQKQLGAELYSIEVYAANFFVNFNPEALFQKWAAKEVSDFQSIPEGMERIIVPGGIYAVFIHKGRASEGPKTYQYIFDIWFPPSNFELDERPHFAVMGEKYKNDSSDSEEELWIPVKPKSKSITATY